MILTIDSGPQTADAAALANARFLEKHGVWHLVSTNPPVKSCRDAYDKRWRLGGRGIPLCDELKSNVGATTTADGRREFVAVHCRGHQHLDQQKIERALNGPWDRIEPEELAREFKMGYGTVTPFGFADRPDVRHIFDSTVMERFFPPHTMMTNLGQLTLGVEFEPADLIDALPRSAVASVVRDEDIHLPQAHTLGILTGNSPGSGRLLWEMIDDHIRRANTNIFRGDIAFPPVVIESVPGMGLSMELRLRETEVRPVVLQAVERLCLRGATVIGIACNTTQYFAPEILEVCQRHDAQFVSIADETADHLARLGIERFDFFGISAVADFGGYSAFNRLNDEFDLVRPNEADLEAIARVGFSVKSEGVNNKPLQGLRNVIRKASATPTIVVALTELSEVLAQHRFKDIDKTLIDTLAILSSRMADIYLRERVQAGGQRPDDQEPETQPTAPTPGLA